MSETITYFYHDHLGSVVGQEEFDSAGNLLDTKTNSYDLYGNPIDKINACFTGKYMDRTGLYYFNARYYDPKAGRFITEDPAKQGEGWYNYCSGNPLNHTDPDGRNPVVGAVLGAEVGTLVAPGPGTVIGAVVGGILGAVALALGVGAVKSMAKAEEKNNKDLNLVLGYSGPGESMLQSFRGRMELVRQKEFNLVSELPIPYPKEEYIEMALEAEKNGGVFWTPKIDFYLNNSKEIQFNLQGFTKERFNEIVEKPQFRYNTVTEMELFEITHDQELLEKTTFRYLNSEISPEDIPDELTSLP